MTDIEQRLAWLAESAIRNPVEWRFLYRNYRGEESWRRVYLGGARLRFGTCDWHPGEQWLLEATDADRGERRTFAVADILETEYGQ